MPQSRRAYLHYSYMFTSTQSRSVYRERSAAQRSAAQAGRKLNKAYRSELNRVRDGQERETGNKKNPKRLAPVCSACSHLRHIGC